MASMLLCAMPCWARAMSDEVPKSIAKRMPGASTRMQVWKRPPLPNESPEPTNRTLTAMGPLRTSAPVTVPRVAARANAVLRRGACAYGPTSRGGACESRRPSQGPRMLLPLGVAPAQFEEELSPSRGGQRSRQVGSQPVGSRLDVGAAPAAGEQVEVEKRMAPDGEDAGLPLDDGGPRAHLAQDVGQVVEHLGRAVRHESIGPRAAESARGAARNPGSPPGSTHGSHLGSQRVLPAREHGAVDPELEQRFYGIGPVPGVPQHRGPRARILHRVGPTGEIELVASGLGLGER